MTKLVVLGILKRGPLHGYEIKRIIQDEMGDWTNIAFGSIYFALAQLTKEGCVQQQDPEIQNARPAKIVYQISEKGDEEFMRLLLDVWKKPEHRYYSLDIGFYFSGYLESDAIKKYLERQMKGIRMAVRHIKKHRDQEMARPEVPPIAEAIFSHTLHHMKAEYVWLKETLEKIDGWRV